jgi:integrase
MLYGNNDPLFPKTQIVQGDDRRFKPDGLKREHWSTASPIRKVFKYAFEAAGLPYFNPHSLRNTLVRLGQSLCRTPEEFKAWSQNLGHDKVLTTFINYGQVESSRQGKIIRELADPQPLTSPDVDGLAKALVREMRETASKLPEKSNEGSRLSGESELIVDN